VAKPPAKPSNVVSLNERANDALRVRFLAFTSLLKDMPPAEMLRRAADLLESGHGDAAQAVAFVALEEMGGKRG
jgi:hypothetical protein